MNSSTENAGQTVVITADVAGFSLATLSLAVQIAVSMNTRLRGLFVEDEDLLRVIRLPISREVSLSTARARPTDAGQMQSALRSLAAQFEKSLKREAIASQVGCSFEYVQGRVHDIGLSHGANITCTILDRGAQSRLGAKSPALPARILWITRASRHELEAMRVVLQKFRHKRIELIVVSDDKERNPEIEISQLDEDRDGEITMHRWTARSLLERLASGDEFDCAVISRHASKNKLASILQALPCPVILMA